MVDEISTLEEIKFLHTKKWQSSLLYAIFKAQVLNSTTTPLYERDGLNLSAYFRRAKAKQRQ